MFLQVSNHEFSRSKSPHTIVTIIELLQGSQRSFWIVSFCSDVKCKKCRFGFTILHSRIVQVKHEWKISQNKMLLSKQDSVQGQSSNHLRRIRHRLARFLDSKTDIIMIPTHHIRHHRLHGHLHNHHHRCSHRHLVKIISNVSFSNRTKAIENTSISLQNIYLHGLLRSRHLRHIHHL